MKRKILVLVFTSIVLKSCVKSAEFETLSTICEESLVANASFAEVKALYQGELTQIQEDLVIEAYIVSSDKAGNFFSVLHFQDKLTNATEGFQIEIDLFESHVLFEPGSKILIKTKGLYLGKSRNVFKLGGTFAGFGSFSVGRLPALKIPEHIFRACDAVSQLTPRQLTINELDTSYVNTLIRLSGLEVISEELELPFAEFREETERILKDCEGNEVILLNSGFADFQSESLPMGNGAITAVLLRDNSNLLLAIRDLDDIDFSEERCADFQQTSNQVFFSELADPENNTGARFVELYNASNEAIDLVGWHLRRYTNANTEVSSSIDLSEIVIDAQNTIVISPNREEFTQVYGFAPDLSVSINSPADSNGDDNLELVDPFGTVIDVFGVVGEDGSGTNHEFEDGRAFRNLAIANANPNYTFSEWIIYNDSGDAGTINQPQIAPQDFTPGVRE